MCNEKKPSKGDCSGEAEHLTDVFDYNVNRLKKNPCFLYTVLPNIQISLAYSVVTTRNARFLLYSVTKISATAAYSVIRHRTNQAMYCTVVLYTCRHPAMAVLASALCAVDSVMRATTDQMHQPDLSRT